MLSQIILVLATALIFFSTTYLFCKKNEKNAKFKFANNCQNEIDNLKVQFELSLKEQQSVYENKLKDSQNEIEIIQIPQETVSNQIKDFLNDLNAQINQKILQKYVFVMCQDTQLKDPNNLNDINALESFTNKRMLKISEEGYIIANSNHANEKETLKEETQISYIIERDILSDKSFKIKHGIKEIARELSVSKKSNNTSRGERDIWILFQNNVEMHIEIKRNDPSLGKDKKTGRITQSTKRDTDKTRILCDLDDLSNNENNNKKNINVFMYFETHDAFLNKYKSLKDLTKNVKKSIDHFGVDDAYKTKRIFKYLTDLELIQNFDYFINSCTNPNFELTFLTSNHDQKRIIKCQNVYTNRTQLNQTELSFTATNLLFFPCEVEYRMILVGKNI